MYSSLYEEFFKNTADFYTNIRKNKGYIAIIKKKRKIKHERQYKENTAIQQASVLQRQHQLHTKKLTGVHCNDGNIRTHVFFRSLCFKIINLLFGNFK